MKEKNAKLFNIYLFIYNKHAVLIHNIMDVLHYQQKNHCAHSCTFQLRGCAIAFRLFSLVMFN